MRRRGRGVAARSRGMACSVSAWPSRPGARLALEHAVSLGGRDARMPRGPTPTQATRGSQLEGAAGGVRAAARGAGARTRRRALAVCGSDAARLRVAAGAGLAAQGTAAA